MKNLFRYLHILYFLILGWFRKPILIEGKTLILAPHPDDEAIGCGGLISHLCENGEAPYVVILTGGGGSLPIGGGQSAMGSGQETEEFTSKDVIRERRKLTLKSAHGMGLPEDHIFFLDFQDGHISEFPDDQMNRLKDIINKINPDNIFIPHWGEGWPDHLAARKLPTANCLRPKIYEYCVWVWYYNIWKMDWKNAFKFRMSQDDYAKKLEAINAYVKPLAPNGKPWCGVLPKPFLWANTRRTELYFKV